LRRPLELRIKNLSSDLNKQISLYKKLKIENDRITETSKTNEEKLNHSERDNIQKKSLIEFYKKKLDELNSKERLDIENSKEVINDAVIKRLNDSIDKLKIENKSLKTRLQILHNEKQLYDEKQTKNEKALNESNDKLEQIKKEKLKIDNKLKQSQRKIDDLEALLKVLLSLLSYITLILKNLIPILF
jgi:chromosome segregation ATPase